LIFDVKDLVGCFHYNREHRLVVFIADISIGGVFFEYHTFSGEEEDGSVFGVDSFAWTCDLDEVESSVISIGAIGGGRRWVIGC
jgi:hypothetical protein